MAIPANTKVPAHVGCTFASPVASQMRMEECLELPERQFSRTIIRRTSQVSGCVRTAILFHLTFNFQTRERVRSNIGSRCADKEEPTRMESDAGMQPNALILFLALCCLGRIPGGAPFSQLHKSGNGSRVDRP